MTEQEYQTETTQRPARRRGLTINRHFTAGGLDPYASVTWSKRTSRIANPDGTVVFEMADAEIPATWSQVAADIMVSKYFRKAGVPQVDAEGNSTLDENGVPQTGPERSARQVIHRLAGCWRDWGEKYGYFNNEEDAQAFYDELAYMLVNQMAAPNSPQWFNTGLNYAYGITGPAQGHYYVDDATGEVRLSEDAYTHPQPHACQPYDAVISTPAGPLRIGDIVTGNLVGLEVYDGSADGAGTTRVAAVKANGEKTVYRIVLKSGAAIEATPDHLVFVRDARRGEGRWARVDEVQPGHRMLISTRTRVAGESDPMHVAEAALAGWLQGDGFVGQYVTGTNRSLTLEFMTINDDEMRAVIGWIEQVFPEQHYHIRAVEAKNSAIDVRRIRLYGEGLRPFVMKYGLLRNGLDHEVPGAIREGGAESQRAYLRSLFQADGTVRLRRRASRTADVVLTTISPALVQGVQTLLLNDGIYSRISIGVERRENRRTPYQLSIGYADARRRFAETIGFISGEKQQKLAVACSDEFAGKALPGLREEIVARIEVKGFEPVFDIQTESGQYLSNNVLVHNCFIQSIADDLVGEGGIMDLWVREARLFKYGSGTGTNFSTLRGEGEPLSGGGTSSGLMSFLRVGDRAAGAIKSGGTTRRAAKMVCLDVDHPDIEAFISWKADEEKKVAALIAAGYPSDYNGDAYATISGQNANNSVRVTNEFIKAVEEDADWDLIRRTDRKVHKTVKARDLWHKIAEAAWACADPGLQYDTTINEWHTSPESGRINASNPCVTGDTLVSTTDGYRRIADLVGQSVEIIAGDGAPALATRVIPTGIKPVYTLRTRSGYSLRLTADHRVLTANRGDVPAGELRDGDRVLLRGAGFGQRTLGREIAEVLGTAVGDGCITGDQGHRFITVGRNERALAERLASSVNSFCSDALDGRARRPKSVLETPTSLRIGTSAAPITALAKRYSVLNYGAAEKRFTDEVFELDRATQAALLRGLFTADGTVADYGEKSQYISLDSTSLALLEQTQLMLLSFGIKSKLYRNRLLGSAQELPGGIYQRQTMHSLRVSRSSRVRFEQEIGFMTESPKAAKLAALNGRVTTYSDRLEDEFLSLEEAGIEPVYDLTEPRTNHFVANGLVVHNCSEYMFLDNTACNLASLNLIKFVDLETGDIDIEAYRHAVRLWTIVLEISVLMAQFPSKEIARLSYDFRTLGLGYANIGTVLMIRGLPYDSDEARAFTSAMTAIMTGESYATSAEMARYLGPFPGYAQNERHMLRVIRNHRRAAYDASAREYEGLSVLPMPLDQTLAPQPLVQAAHEAWDRALAGGELYGYRNAQTTLLAPTGTIGLLMDCDTTGVEPDFALVKFKKLAGGGYFKIANQSIKPALRNLGYSEQERTDILTYVLGTLSLEGAPYINRSTLKERGFTDQDLDKIEAALPGVFELGFAFSPWSLGEETLSHVGVAMTEASAPGFELLRHLGFSRSQIEAANEHICGTMTVEGAPHLKEEHLPVFDTANKCGKKGTRFIHHMGHIKMMAAAQSFLSGAISKTINMPNEATYDDILDAYHQSWVHGLKAMALYRDGSKSSQPLSGKSDTKIDVDETAVEEKVAAAVAAARSEWDTEQAAAVASAVLEARAQWEAEQAAGETAARMAFSPATTGAGQLRFIDETHQAVRRRLPARRRGFTQEARVAGQKVYLRTGEYDDGSLGEIFIDIAKEGAAFRSMINCFAIAVSKGLQYGVPLDEFVDTFTFVRFEPQGMVTGHPNIKIATSMIDYVFRVLGLEYLGRTDLVQNPDAITEPEEDEEPGGTTALFPNWSSPVSQEPAAVAETTTPAPEPGPERPKAEAVSATEPRPAVTVVHDLPARNGNGSREGNGNGHVAINGSGNGHANGATAKIGAQPASALDAALGELMGDAPFCDVCGHITVRNGSCYKCLNCGNSLGCS